MCKFDLLCGYCLYRRDFQRKDMLMNKNKKLLNTLIAELSLYADAQRAKDQQRYMKSKMPYLGVSMPEAKKVFKSVFKAFVPKDNAEYRERLLYFFTNAQYRELWYAGSIYASTYKNFIVEENIDLYIQVIRIAGWWDIVDHIAPNLIGKALQGSSSFAVYLRRWIRDEDLWVRRTALIAQLRYKEKTDFQLLASLIVQVAHEKDFFIRKAIGWALRAYSYVNPEAVKMFIVKNENILSGLSIREGLKVINKKSM